LQVHDLFALLTVAVLLGGCLFEGGYSLLEVGYPLLEALILSFLPRFQLLRGFAQSLRGKFSMS
jgi:hypothetical protein